MPEQKKMTIASAKMEIANLKNQLKEATDDKTNVAKEAQQLRVQVEKCRDDIKRLQDHNETQLAEIDRLKQQIKEETPAVATEYETPATSTFNRGEVGNYAAILCAGIFANSKQRPETQPIEPAAATAIRGAKAIVTQLDKELPRKQNDGHTI